MFAGTGVPAARARIASRPAVRPRHGLLERTPQKRRLPGLTWAGKHYRRELGDRSPRNRFQGTLDAGLIHGIRRQGVRASSSALAERLDKGAGLALCPRSGAGLRPWRWSLPAVSRPLVDMAFAAR